MKFLLALNFCNSQKLDAQIIKRQKIIPAKFPAIRYHNRARQKILEFIWLARHNEHTGS